MISLEEAKKRIKQILLLAGSGIIMLTLLGIPWAALGVAAGTIFGVFNYYFVAAAVFGRTNCPETQKQNRFMKRYLLRLLISAVILGAAVFVGIEFLLGVLLGLILEMLTYFLDVFKLFKPNKKQI